MSNPQETAYQNVVNLLSTANALSLKAFNAKSSQNLNFILLNDTIHLIQYDRAFLWRIVRGRPYLLGASGQTGVSSSSELVNRLKSLVSAIPEPKQLQVLKEENFPKNREEWHQFQSKTPTSILWMPLYSDESELIGLWLEKWEDPQGVHFSAEKIKVLNDYLSPGYAAAWRRLNPPFNVQKLRGYLTKRNISYGIFFLLLGLFLIRIPLRVAAPCEVVARDPYLITAPLEGIIEEVMIHPGQPVNKGDTLFKYDTRVPLQELKIAEKQVEMTQSEIKRVIATGYTDVKAVPEVATLNIKLDKALLDLEYAKSRAKQLIGKSPVDGVAVVDHPDEWRGKPVRVGEKVMVISDPTKTKVKLWIPENDYIDLDINKPIKVFLNPNPERTYDARLEYISQESTITEKHVPSFVAEALWVKKPGPEIKLGSKGTAILYGENVSLFYYIFRKPIATLRTFLNI